MSRFNSRLWEVAKAAVEEAQALGEPAVGTEHLLLGLLRCPESAGCHVLHYLGISPETLRQEVLQSLPSGTPGKRENMQLTSRAKRVIDLGWDETQGLGMIAMDTDHLLLGFLRKGEGFAGKFLAKRGVELEALREAIRAIRGIR